MTFDRALGLPFPGNSVTAPAHGFQPQDWAELPREARRQLVQVLFLEAGMAFNRSRPRAQFDDLIFLATSMFSPRRVCLRVAHRSCAPADLEDLARRAASEDMADFLLIGFRDDDVTLGDADHYLSADEVIELLEASAVVTWRDGVPIADVPSLSAAVDGRVELATQDTLGLQALAPLSRNKLPWAMRAQGTLGSPDDWFERYFFRVATAACGLEGLRFGSLHRGHAVADGILHAPNSDRAALYDCKAARDGYRMTADHERRLLEYAAQPQAQDGRTLRIEWVVVVSSSFSGSGNPSRHPFDARARAFEKRGHRLAYVRAVDVVAAASALRGALDEDTSVARHVDWCSALAGGMVSRETLLSAVSSATDRRG